MRSSDAELVRRFLGLRDQAAFRLLVERHAGTVLGAAQAVTGDLQVAEDATQETFLAAARALRRYDTRRSFRAWLIGIAVKRASKLVRTRVRAKRREKEVAMTPKPNGPSPEEEALRRESGATVREALNELPADKRLALHLHYREGLSHSEVADAMGVKSGTAKSRISRALEALRQKLGKRNASLAVVDITAILQMLPKPVAAPALVEACATKGASVAAASFVPKLIAAAVIVTAGAVVTVASLGNDSGRAPRSESRTAVLEEKPEAVRDAPGEPAPAPPSSKPGGPEIDVTKPVDLPEESRKPSKDEATTTTVWSGEEGTVTINGKQYRIKGLPGLKVIPKLETGQALGPGKGPRFGPRRTGKRSKWAPLPRLRGSSTLMGRVLDANDMPVQGAEVLRMANGVDRSASTVVSFEHLTRIATTAKDGTFVVERQRHGSFLLAVNYQRIMNRPRGMETAHAVLVTVPEEGRTEQIELRMPASVADLTPLRGVVKDEDGKPVRGARIFVDYLERRSDEAGRFDAGLVLQGERAVIVQRNGYELLETTIVVERGRQNVAELVLRLKESGELRLAGHVLDDAGNPVTDATLYLTAGRGTVRTIRSDAQGRYAFEKLPDRLKEQQVQLHVRAQGYFARVLRDVPPLPLDPFEVRLDRAIRVALTVVSAATGEPLQQIVGKMEHEQLKEGQTVRVKYRSWSVYRENGVLADIDCPAGRVFITLEAPGHAEKEIELILDASEGMRKITVALEPATNPPAED